MSVDENKLPRRRFAATLAGGAAAMASSLALAADDDAKPSAELASVPSAELLLELIKRSDPERLKNEHLEQLRGDLAVNLARSARLSAFPLTNADEPAPVFAAWRSEG